MKNIAIIFALLLFSIHSFAAAPVLFFSDLDSGPKTGGENNQGVWVCVYGNFPTTQGASSITVGGIAAASYKAWGSTGLPTATARACFQMGATTPSGTQNIQMTTTGGTSNTLSFTVRSGNIYFLDPANLSGNANNLNPGTAITAPWATYDKSMQTMVAGDTTYVRASTTTTRSSIQPRGVIVPQNAGTALAGNKAIVGYPGETVVIGEDTDNVACSGSCQGIYSAAAYTTEADYWTFARITAHGNAAAIGFSGGHHLRFVDMKATCPLESNWLACFYLSLDNNNSKVLGTEIYDVGTSVAAGGAIKGTHGLYFGTDDHDMEAGWNYVHHLHACRAFQIHSSPVGCGYTDCGDTTGAALYNLSVHDNWAEDNGCSGVAAGTTDPSLGYINIYNNVFNQVGTGNLDPASDPSDYSAVEVDEGNDWLIFNNTGILSADTTTRQITGVGTHFTSYNRGWAILGLYKDAWYLDTITDDTHATAFSGTTLTGSIPLVQLTGLTITLDTTGCSGTEPYACTYVTRSSGDWNAAGNPVPGQYIKFSGFSNAANNHFFTVIKINSATQMEVSVSPYQAVNEGPTVSISISGAIEMYRKSGVGTVKVYNNTVYHAGMCNGTGHLPTNPATDCGAFTRPESASQSDPLLIMELKDNAVYQASTRPYITSYNASPSWTNYITGDHNLWFGGLGTVPTTSDQTGNPLFANISSLDFHPTVGSPLLSNGADTTSIVTTDFVGDTRTLPVTIGAYQNIGGAAPSSNGSIQTSNTTRTTGTVIQ